MFEPRPEIRMATRFLGLSAMPHLSIDIGSGLGKGGTRPGR
jgi:hypothetical protein